MKVVLAERGEAYNHCEERSFRRANLQSLDLVSILQALGRKRQGKAYLTERIVWAEPWVHGLVTAVYMVKGWFAVVKV